MERVSRLGPGAFLIRRCSQLLPGIRTGRRRAGRTALGHGHFSQAAVLDDSTTGFAPAIGPVVETGQRLFHLIEKVLDLVDGRLGRRRLPLSRTDGPGMHLVFHASMLGQIRLHESDRIRPAGCWT